jgi:hypothetical protein
MSVEDVKERLRAAGIPMGEWVDNEDDVPEEGKEVPIPSFQRYAKMLEQLRDIMQMQVDKDVEQIDTLNSQLHRLKHGGGR